MSVTILTRRTVLEFGKTYDFTCEVVGSYPRAKITWLMKKDYNFTSIRETGNSTVVVSTITYSPLPEDNNKQLRCQGTNPMLSAGFLEDFIQLNVFCKFA